MELKLSGDLKLNPGPAAREQLGKKPALHELQCFTYTSDRTVENIYIINGVAARWWNLGIALKFTGAELRAIEKSKFFQVEDCCQEVLHQWLQGRAGDWKPITWETLLLAMLEAQCATVAQKVWKAITDEDLQVNPPIRKTRVKSKVCLAILVCGLTLFIFNLLLVFKQHHSYLKLVHSPTLLNSKQEPVSNFSLLPKSFLQYQHYLQDIYRDHAFPIHSKPSEFVSLNRPKSPIDLVLVHKDKNENEKSHIDQAKDSFHGKVDEIQNEKISVKIKEIGFTSEKKTAHFVLVEGAPGIGKSTLCWQLCRLWLEGKLQHEWDLMVLVEIRDEATRKATSVYDLLYHTDDSIRQSIAQEVQKRQGKGLMIIFDGYDELSDYQRSELSVFQKILSNQILIKATIVVTSRPVATWSLPAKFKQDLDQHIVIEGFNKTDIQSYITLACDNSSNMLEDLRSYVLSRPFIFSVMHNPLHCTIVTQLYIQYWRDGLKVFAPNTLTEIYNTFVLNLLRRNMLPSQLSNIEDFNDLPADVYKNLMQLAELAARGLQESSYIFKNVSQDTLSLMVSVRQLYDNRPRRSAYMFLHLTLQEYLSAFYLSRQLHHLQMSNFLYSIYKQHNRLIENPLYDHWPLLLFLAGLSKLNPIYFDKLLSEKAVSNSDVLRSLCHLLFEAQVPQTVSRIFAHKKTILAEMALKTSLDWFVVGYCVGNSDNTSSWELNAYSPTLKILSDGLYYSNSAIVWDENSRPSITITFLDSHDCLEILNRILYPFTRAIVGISHHHCTLNPEDEGVFVLYNLSHYCPKLAYLKLPELNSSFLTELPQLPSKTLASLEVRLPEYSVVMDNIQEYTSLTELNLCGTKKTDICPLLQRSLPKLYGKLEVLSLSDMTLLYSCVSELSRLTSIKTLGLYDCTISIGNFKQLTTAMTTVIELNKLVIYNLGIDLKMAKSLARLITQSKTLEEVTVWQYETAKDCDVARMLVEAMKHSSVKRLTVDANCENSLANIPHSRKRIKFS